ncbi:chymotrypsin-1-like [Melitaea cinxia]|uniref:chymotrypsin-1-like n=1 Tax=Melitaea cinxia TaxID=113334 RepID=UPI001E270A28|nr:chymotrypsin-1-like [Melitaea cinxia]
MFIVNDFQERILYGEDVKIEDYPFYAALRIEYEEPRGMVGTCGAAIISDIWILTAAHCVSGQHSNEIGYVYVGGESFDNSLQVSYNKVIVHENYQLLNLLTEFKIYVLPIHDIALIRLESPLTFSDKVQPINLPMYPMSDTNVKVIGRGRDETSKLERNICTTTLHQSGGACHGDSGGPLFNGNTLVGLASYLGNKTCETTRVAFYVNVASYVPWIMNNIRP